MRCYKSRNVASVTCDRNIQLLVGDVQYFIALHTYLVRKILHKQVSMSISQQLEHCVLYTVLDILAFQDQINVLFIKSLKLERPFSPYN